MSPTTQNIWFPGHMAGAKNRLSDWLKHCDMFIEVRDARAPLTSSNPALSNYRKFSLLLCNKKQLADPAINAKWQSYFAAHQKKSIFCNLLDAKDIKKIINCLKKQKSAKQKKQQRAINISLPFRVMVLGAPNTGKSTLINRLIAKKRVKTGALPGVTKRLEWVKISADLELLDSPGILSYDQMHNLAPSILPLISAAKDNPLAISAGVEYLLQLLIKQPTPAFLARYRLTAPLPTKASELLAMILTRLDLPEKDKDYALAKVEQKIINDFRSTKLGLISLEEPAS